MFQDTVLTALDLTDGRTRATNLFADVALVNVKQSTCRTNLAARDWCFGHGVNLVA